MPSYDIIIEKNSLSKLETYLKEIYKFDKLFVITDKTVYGLYYKKLKRALINYDVSFVIVEAGESAKSLLVYQSVVEQLIEKKIRRNHLIIAFGGGVIGDLAGFIASTLYRGIAYIQIPTTLLAQVDSSVGSKVGINLKQGKNLIGSFYDPKLVLVDFEFLETLPKREYNNGLAEIIKAGLIGDKGLYEQILKSLVISQEQIIRAIEVKRKIVLLDYFDKKERMILNFGHTFGHAIEKKHSYKTYKHGEAISYGMLFALQIGAMRKQTKPFLYEEVKELLLRANLVKEPLLKMKRYLNEITYDKKFSNSTLNFIVLAEIGTAIIIKMKRSELDEYNN